MSFSSHRPARLLLAIASPARWFLVVVLLSGLVLPLPEQAPQLAGAAGPACATSGPSSGAYTATVCTSTTGSSTLTGNVTVTTTVTAASGSLPAISKVEVRIAKGTTTTTFGTVLSDYAAPYTFTLPTARWTDGLYRLRTHVTLADGFLPTMPVLQVSFANNVTVAPVSSGNWSPYAVGGGSVVIAAVGDGAGGLPGATAVGNLVAGWNPAMFLYLGDVYNTGSYTEFLNYYDTTLGSLKARTNPVPGNHETGTQLKGYLDYWNSNRNYYSTSAGSWHLIALDSNMSAAVGSAQYTWLQQDLQAHAGQCTLVYYHHPRFGLDSTSGNPSMDPVWQLLAQNGVDLVLNGHEHNYSRWQPMNAAGAVDPNGVPQLIAGTGGHQLLGFAKSDARVAKRISNTNGALKLTLSASGAAYQFISTGGSVLDSGNAACADGGQEPPPPTTDVTFTPVADARVNEAAPTTNYGTGTTLVTDAGTGVRVESYLTFTVSGLTGSVGGARIRLYVTNGSADGPDVYRVPDTSWGETSITWANRPARDSSPIDGTGVVPDGAWVELDVTGIVTGNGTYSFALATGSTDGTTMYARQSSTNKPQLIVSVGGSGAPAPTATTTSVGTATATVSPTRTPTPGGSSGQVTVLPAADARVDEANPSTNYGASTLIRTDAGTGVRVETFLKFAVNGLSSPVTSATLRVYASSGSVDGPDVYAVSDTAWTEAGLTWTNRPSRSGTALATTTALTTGTWIELDVTSQVTGNGTYSFALATGSTDGTDMHSREATNKPQLVLRFDGVVPPPATATATPVPMASATATSPATATRTPTPTPVPATVAPTDTALAPTATNTVPAPTDVPTATAVPPTATSVPPTSTPVPVTVSYPVTRTDGGPGTVPAGYAATFDVCVNVAPSSTVTVFLTASHRTRAAASPESLTFGPGASLCQAVSLTDRRKTATFDDTGGQARLDVYSARSGTTFAGLLASGPYVVFPDDV